MDLRFVDPTGDGTEYPTPYPADLSRTSYNGDTSCAGCGIILNPVQSLNSDLCPGCTKRKAAKQIANRMA